MSAVTVDPVIMQTAVSQKLQYLLSQVAEAQINVTIYTQIHSLYTSQEDALILVRETDRLARLETAYSVVQGMVTA